MELIDYFSFGNSFLLLNGIMNAVQTCRLENIALINRVDLKNSYFYEFLNLITVS